MERLTKWENGHAYYPRCFENPCYGGGCVTRDCPFETAICERLAAYEDTGLSPQACAEAREAGKVLSSCDISFGRLAELLTADKDGRVVVLPCKVGDTVWITGSVRRLYSEKVRTFFCGDPSYGRGEADNNVQMIRTTGCDIPIHKFNKTVFLTREEAEKAMKGETEK